MATSVVTVHEMREILGLQEIIKKADWYLGSLDYNYEQSVRTSSSGYRNIYRSNALQDLIEFEVTLKKLLSSEHTSSDSYTKREASRLVSLYRNLPVKCPELVDPNRQKGFMAPYAAYEGVVSERKERIIHYRKLLMPEDAKRKETIAEMFKNCISVYGSAHEFFGTVKAVKYFEKLIAQLEWENAFCAEFVVFSQDDIPGHEFNLITTDGVDLGIEDITEKP